MGQGKYEEMIAEIFEKSNKQIKIKSVSNNVKLAFYLWVRNELKIIQSLNESHLSTEPDAKMIAAGSSKLNELGEFVTIYQLAGEDLTKYNEIYNKPFDDVFKALRYNVLKSRN